MSELFVRVKKKTTDGWTPARRLYYRQRTQELKEQGLCTRCGKAEAVYPFLHCEQCRVNETRKYRRRKGLPEDKPRRDDIGAKVSLAWRNKAEKPKRKVFPGRGPLTPKTGRKWTPADREALVKLFAARTPLDQICLTLGRSKRSILKKGHRLGIEDCDPNNFSTPYLAERIKSW